MKMMEGETSTCAEGSFTLNSVRDSLQSKRSALSLFTNFFQKSHREMNMTRDTNFRIINLNSVLFMLYHPILIPFQIFLFALFLVQTMSENE